MTKKSATKSKPKKQDRKFTTFKARGLFYEPFIMGGDVWQHKAFDVEGWPVELNRGLKGFAAINPVNANCNIYHIETGGYLGHGCTMPEAVENANKNIDETEDLEQQIATMNKHKPLSSLAEIDPKTAWERLAKSKADK